VSDGRRHIVSILATTVALVALALAGYMVVHVRAAGGGTPQPLVSLPPLPSPTPGVTKPPTQHWIVAKATGTVVVRTQPGAGAPVKVTLGKVNENGYPTLMLVRKTREVGGVTWYNVWLALRPNGSRGWVREGDVATYPTVAKIVIDLSARKLSVYRNGKLEGEFPVAVGSSQYPTPTGFFFINQKLRPTYPGGAFGVLAMGISAFQRNLPTWGSVAIHGTNQDALIGQAISHGCIRMHNADVLKVSDWVPSGSPVVIQQ